MVSKINNGGVTALKMLRKIISYTLLPRESTSLRSWLEREIPCAIAKRKNSLRSYQATTPCYDCTLEITLGYDRAEGGEGGRGERAFSSIC